ncbi:hypothetical protein BJY00DRAFT_294252 [Aspergillus carlsbadensis]|nr:hypothetical protein BJY00DRAFT_294252 [Aspergillus carlsbadensis]
MPSTSTLLDAYSITNYGPFTTPFTPTPSCLSTTNFGFGIGYSALPSQINFDDCSLQPPDEACFPSPTDSSAISSVWEQTHGDALGLIQPFYSPATACPDGYATAMTAARDANGTAELSGWYETPTFTPTATATGEGDEGEAPEPTIFAPPDVLVALLDDNETAVWCCPSGFAVGPGNQCLSLLEDYTISTGCNTWFTSDIVTSYTTSYPGHDGETTEGEVVMVTGGSDGVVSTNSFGGESETELTPTSGLVAYATYEPVVIVHREEDLDEEDQEQGADDDDNQDGEEGAANDDDQSDEESQSGDDSANDESEGPSQDEDSEDPEPTGAAVRVGGGGTAGSLGAAVAMIASAVVGASMVLFA